MTIVIRFTKVLKPCYQVKFLITIVIRFSKTLKPCYQVKFLIKVVIIINLYCFIYFNYFLILRLLVNLFKAIFTRFIVNFVIKTYLVFK